MVVPLRPGKFYGSSLPRPRIYTDVKFSDERIDPPVPVLAPLMDWANEAHWSMGGLSLNRPRLQGRIEGNVEKLRKERERTFKKKIQSGTPINLSKTSGGYRADSTTPPPAAPVTKKRRQRGKWVDEDEDEEEEEEEEVEVEVRRKGGMRKRRRLVRKLGDDFELVASKNGRSPLKCMSNGEGSEEGGVALRTRSRRAVVMLEEEEGDDGEKSSDGKKGGKVVKINENKYESGSPSGSRSSPRLKNRLN